MKLGYMSKRIYACLLVLCVAVAVAAAAGWIAHGQYILALIAGIDLFLVAYMVLINITAPYRYFGPIARMSEEANYRRMAADVCAIGNAKFAVLACWNICNVFYLAEPDATTFGYCVVVFVNVLLLYFAWGNLNAIEETTETISLQYFRNKEENNKSRPCTTLHL